MGKDEQTLELVAAIALVVLGSTWLAWGAPAEAREPERSEERASPSLDPTDLEAYLDGVMAVHLRERHIAAAVVTVVQRGEVLVSKGYGFADRERRIAVDPDVTLFRQGSISKLFTWTAVMQLAEQGKLDLHADVNDYLASFKLPATYPQPITLEHLLTHTAGFEGEAGLGYILVRDASELVSLEDSLAAHIPARVRPPGEEPMYSNWGTSLAGLIVARVSGLPFEDYVDQYIFRPLAMSSSTFVEPLPKGMAEDLAVGYEWKAGVFQPVPFEYIGNFAPGGSLTASSADMARFMVAHLQLGRFQESRILSEESARAMQRRAFAFHPSLPGMAYGFYEMDMKGQRIIGHSGDTQAFHSDLALFPDDGLGLHVSYVANGSKARRQLLDAFIDRYLSKPESRKSAPSGKLPSPERRLAGTYRLNRHNESTIAKVLSLASVVSVSVNEEDELIVDVPGQGRLRFGQVGSLVFRQLDGPATAAFTEGSKGKITHLSFSSAPFVTFYRVPWYATPGFSVLLVALALLCSLAVVWRAIRTRRDASREREPRWASRLATITATLTLLFFVLAATVVMVYGIELYHAIPTSLSLVLAFPIAIALLTAGLLVTVGIVWTRGYWTIGRRLRFSFTSMSFAGLTWFHYYWNVLGFQY